MRKESWKRTIAAVLLIVFLIFGTACGENEKEPQEDAAAKAQTEATEQNQSAEIGESSEIEKETAAMLIRELTSGDPPGPGAEWSIIAIARSSLAPSGEARSLFMQYEENLAAKVKEEDGVIDPERPTDNAKAAMALKMTGGDPTSFEGYDLLKALEDKEKVKAQGVNAAIWALIASNVCDRKLDASGEYVEEIRKMKSEEGAITYDGTTPDADITAMAIQALAPMADEDGVSEIIDPAMEWLPTMQKEDGSYGNAESTAQVILALDSLGYDPVSAEGFVKDSGATLFDGLMKYRVGEGFCHMDEDAPDTMATEQALWAIDAINIRKAGSSFYGITDSE